ncbi:unnamed protein product [Cylindrotheca closterium]|uniref:PCIF1 WW domain-containing protein n=1 Tax=Cylindrotheca closterium TaxID=2856 RepID=A0AAD2CHV4_9STRA|nr:unnamed protein product [Cylindrotheca closterium]
MPPPHPRSIWNPAAEIPSTTQVRPCSSYEDDDDHHHHHHHHQETTNDAACFPEQEAARMAALKRLRHKLVTQCAKQQHNAKPPTLAMERWLSRESLQRELSTTTTKEDGVIKDPILPSTGIVDDGLVKDLSRNMEYTEAQSIAETLASDAKTAAERISKLSGTRESSSPSSSNNNTAVKAELKACTKALKKASKAVQKNLQTNGNDDSDESSSSSSSNELQKSLTALHEATQQLDTCRQKIQRIQDYATNKNIVLDNSRRPGICDVMLLQADGTPKKPYLTISMNHLIKFVQLWQFQNHSTSSKVSKMISPKSIAQSPMTAIMEMPDGSSFLRYLYCCLSRYEMIKGAGYQCAMPPIAFDAANMELGLGTTVECFASPFNCRYKHYCSAFPDLERKFGSLGSFFDDSSFFPSNGSFEANPPFVPELMWAMNAKLERILSHENAKALSFLVIVPVWGANGIGNVEELEASKYCVASSRIAAADHSFCDGAQHKALKQELRPSSWDTAVILLQTPQGSEEWPVSQSKLESVFCAALKKSKTRSSLADWERRGVGKGGSGGGGTSTSTNRHHHQEGNTKRPYSSTTTTAPSSSISPRSSFRGKKTKF